MSHNLYPRLAKYFAFWSLFYCFIMFIGDYFNDNSTYLFGLALWLINVFLSSLFLILDK